MNECVVYDRLKEITPVESVDNLSRDDLLKASKTAFNIIGYTPKNLEKSLEKTLENLPRNSLKNSGEKSSKISLFKFLFFVWRCDNDLS